MRRKRRAGVLSGFLQSLLCAAPVSTPPSLSKLAESYTLRMFPEPCPALYCPPRYEVRKKKKVAACIDEIAEMVVEKFTDKLGANKAAWKVQVRGVGRCSCTVDWREASSHLRPSGGRLLRACRACHCGPLFMHAWALHAQLPVACALAVRHRVLPGAERV